MTEPIFDDTPLTIEEIYETRRLQATLLARLERLSTAPATPEEFKRALAEQREAVR